MVRPLPEVLFRAGWIVDKLDPLVIEEAIVNEPSLSHGQRLSLHGRSGGNEPEHSHLGKAAKSNRFTGLFPPVAGQGGVHVFRSGDGEPDVEIREDQ